MRVGEFRMVDSDRFTLGKHDPKGEFLGLAGRPKSAGERPTRFPNQLNSAPERRAARGERWVPDIPTRATTSHIEVSGSIRVVWIGDDRASELRGWSEILNGPEWDRFGDFHLP